MGRALRGELIPYTVERPWGQELAPREGVADIFETPSLLPFQTPPFNLPPPLGPFLPPQFVALKKDQAAAGGAYRDDDAVQDVHALSAGLKAYVTWHTANALNACRESTGGHGYAAVNRLGALRSDHDIFQTFEGDNTVLMQQVASFLLKQYQKKFEGETKET